MLAQAQAAHNAIWWDGREGNDQGVNSRVLFGKISMYNHKGSLYNSVINKGSERPLIRGTGKIP